MTTDEMNLDQAQYGPINHDYGQCKICGDWMHQTHQHAQFAPANPKIETTEGDK